MKKTFFALQIVIINNDLYGRTSVLVKLEIVFWSIEKQKQASHATYLTKLFKYQPRRR